MFAPIAAAQPLAHAPAAAPVQIQQHIVLTCNPPWVRFTPTWTGDAERVIGAALTVVDTDGIPREYVEHAKFRFPIGLFSRAAQALHASGIRVIAYGASVPACWPNRGPMANGRVPRWEQCWAADALEAAPVSMCHAGTAFGKTLVMAMIARDYAQAQVTVLTHRRDLFRQSHEDELQPMLAERIGVIDSDRWEPQRITIAMMPTLLARTRPPRRKKGEPPSLHRAPAEDRTRWDSPAVAHIQRTEVLLLDEGHEMAGSGNYFLTQLCPAAVRHSFTGTPWSASNVRSNIRLEAISGPPSVYIPTVELANRGIAARARVWMIDWGSYAVQLRSETWPAVYTEGVVQHVRRNMTIAVLARRSIAAGRTTLIVFRYHEHGPAIKACLAQLGLDAPLMDGMTSSTERTRVWKGMDSGEIRLAITSIGISKIGLNIHPLRTIIDAAGWKPNQELPQLLGRGVRMKRDGGEEAVDVLDLDDRHAGILAKHARDRINIWTGEGHPVHRAWPPWAGG